jgi:hypothetical protein
MNIELNAGASFSLSFTWLFPDDPDDPKSEFNTPQDLTNWTGQIICAGLPDFPLALTLGGVAGTVYGEVLDTTAWSVGTHEYQVFMMAPDNAVDIILTGKICVKYVPTF